MTVLAFTQVRCWMAASPQVHGRRRPSSVGAIANNTPISFGARGAPVIGWPKAVYTRPVAPALTAVHIPRQARKRAMPLPARTCGHVVKVLGPPAGRFVACRPAVGSSKEKSR